MRRENQEFRTDQEFRTVKETDLIPNIVADHLFEFNSLRFQMGLCMSKQQSDGDDSTHFELAGGNVDLVTTKEAWEGKLSQASREGKIVIANFSAVWCGPCQMIAPYYSELSEKYPSFMFLTIDVDELTSSRKETVLDLAKFVDKGVQVKLTGGRQVTGTLKGYDQLLNLVLDEAIEYLRDPDDPLKTTDQTRRLGLIVCFLWPSVPYSFRFAVS
ncbi:hypothetical protein Cgig2_031903 [Carnegiea gigantea]|uniref:Thioredoxin domain-containing protein n=1 Tax=Carnegiea gigantea TaxID=171969 RepID=A0A9Q1K0K9_9CARY|nr:hypothetical protein Cgig2_010447 [Carnegiea gigantea]KAJ8448179.1 hypothetical protein Cgig2_031903 [Carnegiea gigantea]